jgi:hypothetical protein
LLNLPTNVIPSEARDLLSRVGLLKSRSLGRFAPRDDESISA